MNGNRIASLPHQVVCWSKLVELRMNENGLVQLPETLGMLTSLQHVGFAKNSIDSFPSEVQPADVLLRILANMIRGTARVKTSFDTH